jgi:2-methylcitrate dehydratase PrpD
MTSITDKYINLLFELMQNKFPDSGIVQAKRCLLDYIGVTLAGSNILAKKGNIYLNFFEEDKDDIPIIGFNRKANLYNAALIYGMSAHIAELDDGIRQGSIHLGAPIISALLPIVYRNKLTGEDLLRGIIIGYEAAIRLASAMQPSHRNKGYHTTGTCGTIGAALGIGAALNFTREEMKNVLSVAATTASGLLNVTKGNSELKPYNAGQASVSALMAASVVRAGFNGPADVLGGEWGFLNLFCDKYNAEKLALKQKETLGIEKIYFKPYAACRHAHPAIEAALILKKKYNFDFNQIDYIKVYTYKMAADGHEHTFIEGVSSAKLSIPFGVAVALIRGNAGIDEYTEQQINNTEVLELTKKVNVLVDKELNELVPEKRPAIVQILLKDNKKELNQRVDLSKGEPETPFTDEEIYDKFVYLAKDKIADNTKISQVYNEIMGIEKCTDISELSIFKI